jgi:hypothetical protein
MSGARRGKANRFIIRRPSKVSVSGARRGEAIHYKEAVKNVNEWGEARRIDSIHS